MNTELHRQAETYKEIRKRLWGKPQKPANKNIQPVVLVFTPPKPKPEWKVAASYFDEHMKAYRAHKFNRYISFIKQRCQDIGIEYDEFLNASRKRIGRMDKAVIRHQIRWETKRKFPELSYPKLSKLCGGIDHSSLMWSIRRMEYLLSIGYELQGNNNASSD